MSIDRDSNGLLTDAERDLAQRRVDESGMSEEEAVASVKFERVGPAAITADTPAANVPGGQIAPPSVNGPEQRLQHATAERDRLNDEIATIEADLDARRRAYALNPPPAPPAPAAPAEPETAPGLTAESTDDELAGSNAADLVAFVAANPDQADRVRGIEEQREKPRSTVLDAVGGAA